jgi:hypothetical protein
MLKLRFLSGDINWKTFGAKWITKKLNNGDFDYWLIVAFINFEEATGEKCDGNRYVVEIHAVAPSQISETDKNAAFRSIGLGNEDKSEYTEEQIAEVIESYGISANLKTLYGNNANNLMKEARKDINLVSRLFGFFMDKPENAIGSTGWDIIKGDLTAGLYKTRAIRREALGGKQ